MHDARHATIPFEDINAAALAAYPGLLAEWFPAGRLAGHEFQLGDLSGKPGESLSINVSTGKWADFASDAKGGDPISLFAAAFHAGDRVQAARELGQRFGVMGAPAPRPAAPPPAAPAGEDWTPQVPPPPGAPEAPLKSWDHVYAYRDADGAVLRYVVRRDARAGATGAGKRKQILPLTYGVLNGKLGWHHKHASAPRHLYGLDRLSRPKAVIVCEGEKAADAAHRMLPDNPCLTWSAGSNAVRLTDWSPTAGRVVVIWPDADAPGLKAAAEIADVLRGVAKKILFVDTTGLADGFDAADLEVPDPAVWLRERMRDEAPAAAESTVAPTTPAETAAPQPAQAPAARTATPSDPRPPAHDPRDRDQDGVEGNADAPFRCLGYNKGVYYYLSFGHGQVVALPASGHSKNTLLTLAPLYHWESHYAGSRGCNWDMAINSLFQTCHAMGVFDPETALRGRGAWLDEDRAVLHLGDYLMVDGRRVDIKDFATRHVYEMAPSLAAAPAAAPLSAAEAHRLLDLVQMFRWERPMSAYLLAGWCVIAPVCGALRWRPHIWVTSPAGSGKSTLIDEVVKPMLGGMALTVMSVTSEAGVRQRLQSDARPVVFDEAEQEDLASKNRMKGVLYLARAASAEVGAEIIKGTQSQSGAKAYRTRSCFAFSSINVGIEHYADETRITVLGLEKIDGSTPERRSQNTEHWRSLKAMIVATVKPDYVAGMLARTLSLLPTIRANADTFAEAAAQVLGSRRIGDQIGAMLAGAYSLHGGGRLTVDQAREWLVQHDWGELTAADAEKDESRLLATITQEVVRVQIGSNPNASRTIGELLNAARDAVDRDIASDEAAALGRLGIRVHYWPPNPKAADEAHRPGGWGFYVSTSHKQLKALLRDTPWGAGWRRALTTIDGHRRPNGNISFGGVSTPAVWVPFTALSSDAPGTASVAMND
ncbi:hypothetical protein TSH58p_22750 (plasmid) [Azospirillum sp. TSH58]|uniref:hypothetical protein n=1 Tax=Azospirillum sp. TSH58 TaxID=664962 RepID=UPI000D6005C5|nr:hypothetical protein [Azospirillum sp. TSH58]AWJ86337.1 hypothetical protein TSH58p_22750 [Azospirillum sp. TSH58]